jgi:hypothetical protein
MKRGGGSIKNVTIVSRVANGACITVNGKCDFLIANCALTSYDGDGVRIHDSNVVIRECKISDCRQRGIYGNGSISGFLERNVIDSCMGEGGLCIERDDNGGALGVFCFYNVVRGCRGYGVRIGDGCDATFQRNEIYNNARQNVFKQGRRGICSDNLYRHGPLSAVINGIAVDGIAAALGVPPLASSSISGGLSSGASGIYSIGKKGNSGSHSQMGQSVSGHTPPDGGMLVGASFSAYAVAPVHAPAVSFARPLPPSIAGPSTPQPAKTPAATATSTPSSTSSKSTTTSPAVSGLSAALAAAAVTPSPAVASTDTTSTSSVQSPAKAATPSSSAATSSNISPPTTLRSEIKKPANNNHSNINGTGNGIATHATPTPSAPAAAAVVASPTPVKQVDPVAPPSAPASSVVPPPTATAAAPVPITMANSSVTSSPILTVTVPSSPAPGSLTMPASAALTGNESQYTPSSRAVSSATPSAGGRTPGGRTFSAAEVARHAALVSDNPADPPLFGKSIYILCLISHAEVY